MWLQEFHRLFPNATERHTGRRQDLDRLERALATARERMVVGPAELRTLKESETPETSGGTCGTSRANTQWRLSTPRSAGQRTTDHPRAKPGGVGPGRWRDTGPRTDDPVCAVKRAWPRAAPRVLCSEPPMAPELVTLAVDGAIGTLTMRRPPVNAMSRAFMEELGAGLDACAGAATIRVIVIRSGLVGMWSGGADIRELQGLDAAGCAAFIELGHRVFGRLGLIPKPVIAAIDGVCVGGGLELAMACDLRLATASSRFGQPEVSLGVVSGWGGTQRLPRLVGKGRGLEMLMRGEPIPAGEALAIGLANRVAPDGALMDEALGLARRLATKSPTALAKVKECVERGLPLPLAEGLREEARCYVEAYAAPDAAEGIRAFLEKRPARFGP